VNEHKHGSTRDLGTVRLNMYAEALLPPATAWRETDAAVSSPGSTHSVVPMRATCDTAA
jgi:hypothetical protein